MESDFALRKRLYEEIKWSLRRIKDKEIDRIMMTEDKPALIIDKVEATIGEYDADLRVMAEKIYGIDSL